MGSVGRAGEWRTLAGVAALLLALRFALLAHVPIVIEPGARAGWEEILRGTAATEFARGPLLEPFEYQWNALWGGSLVAALTAVPSFACLGSSLAALRLPPILWSLVGLLLVARLTTRAAGSRAGLVAALSWALAPPVMQLVSAQNWGTHAEASVIGLAMYALARRARRWRPAWVGLAVGASLSFGYVSALFLVALGLAFRRELLAAFGARARAWFLGFVGFVAGLLPQIAYWSSARLVGASAAQLRDLGAVALGESSGLARLDGFEAGAGRALAFVEGGWFAREGVATAILVGWVVLVAFGVGRALRRSSEEGGLANRSGLGGPPVDRPLDSRAGGAAVGAAKDSAHDRARGAAFDTSDDAAGDPEGEAACDAAERRRLALFAGLVALGFALAHWLTGFHLRGDYGLFGLRYMALLAPTLAIGCGLAVGAPLRGDRAPGPRSQERAGRARRTGVALTAVWLSLAATSLLGLAEHMATARGRSAWELEGHSPERFGRHLADRYLERPERVRAIVAGLRDRREPVERARVLFPMGQAWKGLVASESPRLDERMRTDARACLRVAREELDSELAVYFAEPLPDEPRFAPTEARQYLRWRRRALRGAK